MAEDRKFRTFRRCLVIGSILLLVLLLGVCSRSLRWAPESPGLETKLLLKVLSNQSRHQHNTHVSAQVVRQNAPHRQLSEFQRQSVKIQVIQVKPPEQPEPGVVPVPARKVSKDTVVGVVRAATTPTTAKSTYAELGAVTPKPSIVPGKDGRVPTVAGILSATTPAFWQARKARVCDSLSYPQPPQPLPSGPDATLRWQPVSGAPENYVISAFWDRREVILGYRLVKVVAVSTEWRNARVFQGLYCQVWPRRVPGVSGQPKAVWGDTSRYLHLEHHDAKYAVVIYKCSVPENVTPDMVSLVRKQCEAATNLLTIVDTGPREAEKPRDVAVCVSGPLHDNYGDTKQLVNFIEINRALGANYFYFYNHSGSAALLPTLEQYRRDGLLELFQWQPPSDMFVHSESPPAIYPDVHYFGEVAALQDCLLRSVASAKYLVNLDIDELIFPRQSDTLHRMLQSQLGAEDPESQHGAYLIASSFFPASQSRSGQYTSTPDVINYGIRPLYLLHRQWKIFPHRERSKYIVHTDRVEVLGIHFIYSFVDIKWTPYHVPADVALVHHYRDDHDHPDVSLVLDDSALSFANHIIQKIIDRYLMYNQ